MRHLVSALTGVVFVVAGVAKALSPEDTDAVLAMFTDHALLREGVLVALPRVECALGIAFVGGIRSSRLYGYTLALLGSFTAFLAMLWIADPMETCSCFGPVIDSWTGGGIVAGVLRNTVLMMLVWLLWLCDLRSKTTRQGVLS